MRGLAVMVPMLLLAACGPTRAPQDHEPLTDGRGGHAGTFNAAGDGNNATAIDNAAGTNTQAGNSQ